MSVWECFDFILSEPDDDVERCKVCGAEVVSDLHYLGKHAETH